MSWMLLRRALKQSGDVDGQSISQTDGVMKEGLTVDACVALDLHVLCFKSSSASRNRLKEWRQDRYECDTASGLCYEHVASGETPTSASA